MDYCKTRYKIRFSILFLICILFLMTPLAAQGIQVDANGDGQAGDSFNLATEAIDSDVATNSNQLPSLRSLMSIRPPNLRSNIKSLEFELGGASLMACPAGKEAFVFTSPTSALVAGTAALVDTLTQPVPCSLDSGTISCESTNLFTVDPSLAYHLACDDDGTTDSQTTPLPIQIPVVNFFTSASGIGRIIDDAGDPVFTSSNARVITSQNQLATCISERANHIIDDRDNSMSFIGGETVSRVSVSIFDRNITETSNLEVTGCADPFPLDFQDFRGTFLLTQTFGSGALADLEFTLNGINQAAIREVRTLQGTQVLYDDQTGGWQINGLQIGTFGFDLTVDGLSQIDEADFTLSLRSYSEDFPRKAEPLNFTNIFYFMQAQAGSWTLEPVANLSFPHWVNGLTGNTPNKTRIVVRNSGLQREIGIISFKDSSGNPALVPVNGVAMDRIVFSVEANGVYDFQTDGTGTFASGSAEVKSARLQDSRLTGSEVFQVLGNYVSVPSTPPVGNAEIFVSHDDSEKTGVALYNPDPDRPLMLELILFDSLGDEQARKQIRLEPGQQAVQFIHQEPLFPDFFAGLSSPFRGAMTIEVVNAGQPALGSLQPAGQQGPSMEPITFSSLVVTVALIQLSLGPLFSISFP